MADKPVTFEAEGARRIVNAVRRVEGTNLPQPRDGQANNSQNWQPPFLGKTAAAIAKGATGTINIYFGATKGSETWDGTTTLQAYCRMGSVGSGKFVYVFWILGGWEIMDPEC